MHDDPLPINTEEQLINLMKSCKNEQEWNDNWDRIRCTPARKYWWSAIMMSGLAHQIQSSWTKSGSEWTDTVSNDLFGNTGPVNVIHLKPPTPDDIEKWMNK